VRCGPLFSLVLYLSTLLFLYSLMPDNPAIKNLRNLKVDGEWYPDPEDPAGSVQLALEQLRGEFPQEIDRIQTGPFPKLLQKAMPYTTAVAAPGNKILWNPKYIKVGHQPSTRDLMAHELTHIRQTYRDPLHILKYILNATTTPHRLRPAEIEAENVARRHQGARRDIELPNED
jgi:hypothetical protein